MSERLSPAQRSVLEWMVAYPGLRVSWAGPGNYPMWTAYWASEDARQHMIGVVADLLGDDRRAEPRTFPRDATPRVTTQTFVALMRRGYIRIVGHRPAHDVWAEMSYWQISLAGTQALNPGLTLIRGDLGLSA